MSPNAENNRGAVSKRRLGALLVLIFKMQLLFAFSAELFYRQKHSRKRKISL
jgi:hypothetical protein